MLIKVLCFLLTIVPITAPIQAGWLDNWVSYFRKPAPAKPPTIKVLVVADELGVVLEVKGRYKIFDPNNNDHISTRFVGKRKFIQAVRDGLKWGEEFPGIHQLLIVPDEPTTTIIVDGIEYNGRVYIYAIEGTISVVNEVYIEDYLSSILTSRYRQPLPEEELAAIAITARTAAYYRGENPKTKYWAVDGRQVGYQGLAAINITSPMESAILKTRYMVMSLPSSNQENIQPFLSVWTQEDTPHSSQDVISKITLNDAEEMAKNGEHAAQILAKAFPGVKIELIHYAK